MKSCFWNFVKIHFRIKIRNQHEKLHPGNMVVRFWTIRVFEHPIFIFFTFIKRSFKKPSVSFQFFWLAGKLLSPVVVLEWFAIQTIYKPAHMIVCGKSGMLYSADCCKAEYCNLCHSERVHLQTAVWTGNFSNIQSTTW